MADKAPHLLIVEARFYEEIADSLQEGAILAIKDDGASYDIVSVPGVLEVPTAVAIAIDAMEDGGTVYDGFVVLGCVIRGETTHYEIVANESARALMDLSVSSSIPIGNAILTVENEAQAWARAKKSEKNKGAEAANAALSLIALSEQLSVRRT